MIFDQYNTTDRTYWFPTFTCQYPDCCHTMTYDVLNTATPSDPPSAGEILATSYFTTPTLDSDASGTKYGEYMTTVYTGDITSYYVYIYGRNSYGDSGVSTVVNITVRYNCLFATITLSTVTPTYSSEPKAADYKQLNGYPTLIIDEKIGQITSYSANLTLRFATNVTAPHCELIAW